MGGKGHITLAAVIASALAVTVAGAQEAASPAKLGGVWHLDKSHSEAPRAPEGMSRSHGGFGPGGASVGGRHGGMRPGGDLALGGGRDVQGTGGLLGGAESIKVDVLDNEVRIISDDGHVRIITPDGQPVQRERELMTVTETANWQDGRIIVTTSTEKGLAITETFGLAEDGSGRLVHTIQVMRPDSKEPRTARWVYDSATEER
jgi:hypothetical protein